MRLTDARTLTPAVHTVSRNVAVGGRTVALGGALVCDPFAPELRNLFNTKMCNITQPTH